MPNCFQLTRRGETVPASLAQVDSAICQALELTWDPKHWAYGWYDYIGFKLASGRTFQQITDDIRAFIIKDRTKPDAAEWLEIDYVLLRINHFLLENYQSDCWVEIGRR